MIIQMCGLSGAGKSSLALSLKEKLKGQIHIEVIDGDEYRQNISRELGFTKEDRMENIRRLAFIAGKFTNYDVVPVICAINPYNTVREEIKKKYDDVYLVYINCELDVLFKRDAKGLYARTKLEHRDPEKLNNLSGVNDPFEEPDADLEINTSNRSIDSCTNELLEFVKEKYRLSNKNCR